MKFGPKAKIILYVLLAVIIFTSSSYKVDLVLLCIVSAFASRVPLTSLKRGMVPIMLFLAFTFISNVMFQEGRVIYKVAGLPITYDGLVRGGELTLRLFILILGAKLLTASTAAEALVSAMSGLLGPVGRLGYVKELIDTMSLTLRLLPIVYEEAMESFRSIKNSDEPGLSGKIKFAVELLAELFNRSLKKAKDMSESENGNTESQIDGDKI